MPVNYGKIQLPSKILLDEATATDTYSKFVAEAFEKGYGHTVGSSMRRILLTSIEAPAIMGVRMDNITHEYMADEGIVEDMTDILLNIKGACLRRLPMDDTPNSRQQRILSRRLTVSQEDLDAAGGQFKVTLSHILEEGIFEVVNPNLHIFTLTQPKSIQIDLRVGYGKGYCPSERHTITDPMTHEILVDAIYSPVRNVAYYVQDTRVGQDTDYDQLVLEVTTDGRITPSEALTAAAYIAEANYAVFREIGVIEVNFEEAVDHADSDMDQILEKLCLRIDEIELSVRSTNCLSGANISTIAELVSIPERRMLEFRNFGKKSLEEIKEALTRMGLRLGMDLTPFGITPDNMTERVKELQEHFSRKDFTTVEEEI